MRTPKGLHTGDDEGQSQYDQPHKPETGIPEVGTKEAREPSHAVLRGVAMGDELRLTSSLPNNLNSYHHATRSIHDDKAYT